MDLGVHYTNDPATSNPDIYDFEHQVWLPNLAPTAASEQSALGYFEAHPDLFVERAARPGEASYALPTLGRTFVGPLNYFRSVYAPAHQLGYEKAFDAFAGTVLAIGFAATGAAAVAASGAAAGGAEVGAVAADAPAAPLVASSAASEISPEIAADTAATATGSGAPTAETVAGEQAFTQGAAQAGGGSILSTLSAVNTVAGTAGTLAKLAAPKASPPARVSSDAPSLGSGYGLPGAESSLPSSYSPGSVNASGAPVSSSTSSTMMQIVIGTALALGLGWVFMQKRSA